MCYSNNNTTVLVQCMTLPIGEFRNVFKFDANSVNKRMLLTTAKLARGLPDLATINACKMNSSNRNHIERSRALGEGNGSSLGISRMNIH